MNLAFPAGKTKERNSELSNDFIYSSERDEFISEYTENLLAITPVINGERLPHYRELSIQNDEFELIIRPDGGIENGWAIHHKDEDISIEDIQENIILDFKLHNLESHREGILYTVVWKRK